MNATGWNILTSMRIISTLLPLCVLSACTAPTTTLISPTPLPATPTFSSFASRETLTGDWLGAATKPDGTTASIQITFADSKISLSIEPQTKIWDVVLQQNNEAVQFTASSEKTTPFKQIELTGTFVNGGFSGKLNWDGTTSSVVFTPIVSVDESVLANYEGVYRFESGRALSVIVSPEYTSGGLRFFSQSLMLTDFNSGALRGLYPFDKTTFGVGELRVVGAPFAGRIQFISDEKGTVTGLKWWDDVNLRNVFHIHLKMFPSPAQMGQN